MSNSLIAFTCRSCGTPIKAAILGNNVCGRCRVGFYADEDRGRYLVERQRQHEDQRWERM